MPRLVEIDEKYENMGVRVVSIDSGARSAAAEEFLKEKNVQYKVLNDLNDEVNGKYRIVAIPVTILIDQEGRMIYRHLGFTEEMVPRVEKEIGTLIAWRDAG